MQQPPWGSPPSPYIPPPPPYPAPKPFSWKRFGIISLLAALGWFFGGLTGVGVGDAVLPPTAEAAIGVVMLAGMWIGLVAGIILGVHATKGVKLWKSSCWP